MKKIMVKSGFYKTPDEVSQLAKLVGVAQALEFYGYNNSDKSSLWRNGFALSNPDGYTDMHRAVLKADINAIESLLSRAPKEMLIIGVGDTEETVLDTAIFKRNREAIKLLVNPNIA